MASTIIYRPILMLSSLASAYNLRSRDIPRHRSLSETTLPTSASAPDMSVVVSSQHTRSPAVVNLSRKKMAMAQKLMDEALVEDAEGWMGNDEPMDAHGDYVCEFSVVVKLLQAPLTNSLLLPVHLFCMAVSSLLSALPTTSLARHPVASQQLRSTLLSASDQLHLGLASQDDTRILNPAAHAEVMDMKERVVGLLVWFMLWIRWSEVRTLSWAWLQVHGVADSLPRS